MREDVGSVWRFDSPMSTAWATLPFALSFPSSPSHSHLLAAADEDGHVSIINTRLFSSRDCPIMREYLPAHMNAVFDVTWSNDASLVATASADQTVRLIDVDAARPTFTFTGHVGSVKSVAASPNEAIYASGGRDGTACVWDARAKAHLSVSFASGKRPRSRSSARTFPPTTQSVTAVAFVGAHTLLSALSSSPALHFHDLRYTKPQPLLIIDPPATLDSQRLFATSSVHYHEATHSLAASYTNHSVVAYRLLGEGGVCGAEVDEVWSGGHRSNFYTRVRWEEGGQHVACGSADGGVWIYGRGKAAGTQGKEGKLPLTVLRGHEEEVGCVAWSRTERFTLASGSDDHTVRMWRPEAKERREEGEGEPWPDECSDEEDGHAVPAERDEDVHAAPDPEAMADFIYDRENEAPAGAVIEQRVSLPTSSSTQAAVQWTPLRDISNQHVGRERATRKRARRTPSSAPSRATSASPSLGQANSQRSRTLLELWALPAESKEPRVEDEPADMNIDV